MLKFFIEPIKNVGSKKTTGGGRGRKRAAADIQEENAEQQNGTAEVQEGTNN